MQPPPPKRKTPMRRFYRLLSLGFGLSGYGKLMAMKPQRDSFRSWGWPDDIMLIVGGLELGGAVLMANRRTRHIGAATVTATSVAMLAAELEHGQEPLTPARVALLLATATALI